MKHLATLALLATLPVLAACQREAPAPAAQGTAGDPAPQTALGRTVAKAMDEARKELREGNLSLNGDYDVQVNGKRIVHKTSDLPSAEITPDGQLLVSGQAVPMDDASRAMARDYRTAMIAIAEAGMDMGVQGADLGIKVAADAIGSVLRGDTEDMEKRVEAEARKFEASAMQLCDQLPALLSAQQSLAAAVPDFAPYAKVDAGDIDDCRNEGASVTTAGDSPAEASMDAAAMADAAADATPSADDSADAASKR